jgi:hypothetical protein
MVRERIKEAHEDMHRHGVRVCVLMATSDKGHAVKHGGYPANATVSVVPLKDRVTKGYDAEIIVDQLAWDGLRPRQRLALIAHEVNHLRLVRKKDKFSGMLVVQVDDIGRPKLKTVPGDWNAGDGFRTIVREFGDDAIEFANIRAAWAFAEQAAKDGPEEPEPSLLDYIEPEPDDQGEPATVEPAKGDAHYDRLAEDLKAGKTLILRAGLGLIAEENEDAWKQFPIERWTRFGLTRADVAKLAEGRTRTGEVHPITTVGDLSNFTSNPARPGRGLADIVGFGMAAMDRFGEAESRFWAWWRTSGELAFSEELGAANGAPSLAGTGSEAVGDGGLSSPGDAEPEPVGAGFDLIGAIDSAEQARRDVRDEPAHVEFTKGW